MCALPGIPQRSSCRLPSSRQITDSNWTTPQRHNLQSCGQSVRETPGLCSTQREPSPALRSAASGEGVVPRSSGEGCLSGAVTLSQGTQQPTATPTQGSGGINVPAPAPPPGAPADARCSRWPSPARSQRAQELVPAVMESSPSAESWMEKHGRWLQTGWGGKQKGPSGFQDPDT